jgi:hypothetical protein
VPVTSCATRLAAGGWLRSILARSVVDAHRRLAELPAGDVDELDALIPDIEDPAAVLAAAEEEMTLRAALRTLAPADRVAVVLHDAEDWPAAQLAELLGVGADAAHKRVQRARTRLIAALAGLQTPPLPADGTCRDARAHAHGLLDGTLDETTRAKIQMHLDSCPSCPAALQAAAGVLSALHAEHGVIPIPEPLRTRLDELVREADEAS